jgi:hypothetical protein
MVFWKSKIGDENNFSKLGLNSNLICGLATLIFFRSTSRRGVRNQTWKGQASFKTLFFIRRDEMAEK